MRPSLYFNVLFCVFISVLTTACGGGRESVPLNVSGDLGRSKGYYKVGKPYEVKGVRYVPTVDFNYNQTGIASWYGPGFHAENTANGEIYNQNDMTAAHKTLQLPSIARVTNLDNGREIVVRINDRGPFVRGRIIDLSKRAAEQIDMLRTGTARVRVEILPNESTMVALAAQQGIIKTVADLQSGAAGTTLALNRDRRRKRVASGGLQDPRYQTIAPDAQTEIAALQSEPIVPAISAPIAIEEIQNTAAAQPPTQPLVPHHYTNQGVFMPNDRVVQTPPMANTRILIQVGAFGVIENAKRLAETLRVVAPSFVESTIVGGNPFHRVRLGPLQDATQADRVLDQLVRMGYTDAKILID